MSKVDSKLVSVNLNGEMSCPPSPNLMGGATRIAQDTLVLTLYLDSSASKIFSILDDAKDYLQATDHENEKILSFGVADCKMLWNLQRTGTRRYPYMLKNGDITLLLSKRNADSPMPSGELHIGSMSCQLDPLKVFNTVSAWLALNSINVVRDQVSRVDLAVDVPGFNLNDPDLRIFDPAYYVRRTRDFKDYSCFDISEENVERYRTCEDYTGVMIGGKSSPLKLRIYDKILELKKRENEAKRNFFANLWGGLPENVTRVEFQLRRDALKEFLEIGCYSDLLNNIHKIWKYLTTIWFRHSVKVVDRENRNQNKMIISSFWKVVQSATIAEKPSERKKHVHVMKPLSMLKSQIKGLMTTIIAGEVDHVTGEMVQHHEFFNVLSRSTEIVREIMTEAMDSAKDWERKFSQRRLKTVLWDDVLKDANVFDYGGFKSQISMFPF